MHLYINRNNMTFIPKLHNITVREAAFFIPVQLTSEWPLHATSAVPATLKAISFALRTSCKAGIIMLITVEKKINAQRGQVTTLNTQKQS